MTEYALEKVVWTQADFDQMGWHDGTVHAVAFHEDDENAELLLDIDYILKWIRREPPEEYFTFLVAPATLVFENVWSLEGELGVERTLLEIQDIHRLEPANEGDRAAGLQRWRIEGQGFEISFVASGFRQHFRASPVETPSQRLSLGSRGGISFEQPSALPS